MLKQAADQVEQRAGIRQWQPAHHRVGAFQRILQIDDVQGLNCTGVRQHMLRKEIARAGGRQQDEAADGKGAAQRGRSVLHKVPGVERARAVRHKVQRQRTMLGNVVPQQVEQQRAAGCVLSHSACGQRRIGCLRVLPDVLPHEAAHLVGIGGAIELFERGGRKTVMRIGAVALDDVAQHAPGKGPHRHGNQELGLHAGGQRRRLCVAQLVEQAARKIARCLRGRGGRSLGLQIVRGAGGRCTAQDRIQRGHGHSIAGQIGLQRAHLLIANLGNFDIGRRLEQVEVPRVTHGQLLNFELGAQHRGRAEGGLVRGHLKGNGQIGQPGQLARHMFEQFAQQLHKKG